MASTTNGGGAIGPPEPDLTPAEMIRRAVAMRPELVRRQAEVEELRYYPEDSHEASIARASTAATSRAGTAATGST